MVSTTSKLSAFSCVGVSSESRASSTDSELWGSGRTVGDNRQSVKNSFRHRRSSCKAEAVTGAAVLWAPSWLWHPGSPQACCWLEVEEKLGSAAEKNSDGTGSGSWKPAEAWSTGAATAASAARAESSLGPRSLGWRCSPSFSLLNLARRFLNQTCRDTQGGVGWDGQGHGVKERCLEHLPLPSQEAAPGGIRTRPPPWHCRRETGGAGWDRVRTGIGVGCCKGPWLHRAH